MPSPQPSPTGEGAGCSRFKCCRSSEKECPNINSRNFSGSLYRKADVTNAASVFSDGLWTIGRVCAARHARGGLGLQGKWRTRACVPHTPYMRATACLIPTALPHPLSPWERVRERATSRKACVWAVRALGKIAAIREMPSPQPSPTGEGAGYSDFCGCRQFEKQLGFTTVDAGRLKSKKQPAQPVFLTESLIPTTTRPLKAYF